MFVFSSYIFTIYYFFPFCCWLLTKVRHKLSLKKQHKHSTTGCQTALNLFPLKLATFTMNLQCLRDLGLFLWLHWTKVTFEMSKCRWNFLSLIFKIQIINDNMETVWTLFQLVVTFFNVDDNLLRILRN